MAEPLSLVHGWGWGAFAWADWLPRFPQAQLYDRGYFGSPRALAPLQGLAVCHSQGLHVLLQQDLAQLQRLVVLNGFVDFTPQRRAVQAMANRLQADPQGLLGDFYRNNLAPAPCPFSPPALANPGLLASDLWALLTPADLTKLPRQLRIWLVWGGQDAILHPRQREALTQALPQAQCIHLPEAGHLISYATLSPLLEAI